MERLILPALRIQNESLRRFVFRFRCGKVGFNKICQPCGRIWNRSHMEECSLLRDSDAIGFLDWRKYYKELEILAVRFPHATHYTIIDSLINRQKWEQLRSIMTTLDSSLCDIN